MKSQCLKIIAKVSFNIASEASYAYIFSGQTFIKNAQNGQFWHFPLIFFLLKVTCLVTLFDCKLRFSKNSPKWTIFWHFLWTFVHSKCKCSSLRPQCWMWLFLWFSNTMSCKIRKGKCIYASGKKKKWSF